jgi:hypothetical protein
MAVREPADVSMSAPGHERSTIGMTRAERVQETLFGPQRLISRFEVIHRRVEIEKGTTAIERR